MRTLYFILLCVCSSVSLHAQTRQEWKDSVIVLQKKIDAKPRDIELRMRKAEANINLEQWSYAMDEYNTILEQHPHHIGALYFRGFVNSKLKRWSFARADYEDVLKLEPIHKGAMTGYAMACLNDNKEIEAFDVANRLVDAYPDDAMVFMTRAHIEAERGMRAFAIDDIDKAIELETARFKQEHRPLTTEDDLCFFITKKISLLDKKKDKHIIRQMHEMLVSLGLSSGDKADEVISFPIGNRGDKR